MIITETQQFNSLNGGTIAGGEYVWRGPANIPVFSLKNCRDVESSAIDVVLETPCEAVVVVERTQTGGGVIPSTNNGFSRWRIFGNSLAPIGFWYRGTGDNNEHGKWDACSVYGCGTGWMFEGQQSKEHLISHCRFENGAVAVKADSGFQWVGGCIAVANVAFALNRVGEPVVITGAGVEACGRMMFAGDRGGLSTASQPITITGCRFEADQLHIDGDMIVLRHAGVLNLVGNRFGGGRQRIPRIFLNGYGEQSIELRGNTFGSFGAYAICPIRAQKPNEARVAWGRNVYARQEGSAVNTDARKEWSVVNYV